MKRQRLHLKIAARLKADIAALQWDKLPTLRALHERYGVSLNTMSAALHELSDQGVLDVVHGRGTAVRRADDVKSEAGGTGAKGDSSTSRLCARIRRSIEDGTYRAGDFLPKQKYFVVTEKVTDATVCRALALLGGRNLLHKKGKRWVVGPSPRYVPGAPSIQPAGPSSPVILILVPDYERWREFFVKHLRLFGLEFFAALRRHDVQFVVVQAEEMVSLLPHYHPVGRRQILKTIDELGKRYQGVFVYSAFRAFADIQDWIAWLLQFGKPVVWFDYDNSAPSMDRGAIGNERYFRLYSSIDAAVALAIDALKRYGHSGVGVAMHGPYVREGWSMRRIEAIRSATTRNAIGLSVESVENGLEKIWPAYGELREDDRFDDAVLRYANDIESVLREAHPRMSPNRRRRALRDELVRSVPSLASLVEKGCTAVVTLNQYMGVNTLYWLKLVGLEPPRDMSLISFDNIPSLANHPISTVDFGLANLGYQAAHLFIGDIPVRADRLGNMGSEPTFIDRGSIGPPRTPCPD
jgi:DNA-binding transcriptional regulator YhcF (GntR family)